MSERSAFRRGLAIAAAALALVALGALVPWLVSSRPARPFAPTSPGQISGTLVCLECELTAREARPGLEATLRRPKGAEAGDPALHGRLHLRDETGEVWTLVTRPSVDAEVLEDHSLAGRRATVFGVPEPRLHAVDATRIALD